MDTLEKTIAEQAIETALDLEKGNHSYVAETYWHEDGSVTLIVHDDDPSPHADPRDADNLGIMLANGHRNYNLGDYQLARRHSEYDDAARALEHFAERGKIRLFPRWCAMVLGSTVVLPLGLIDHSGISMYVAGSWLSTGDASNQFDPGGWDSGLVGFIFDTADTRETCGTDLEHVEEGLRGEVKVYDQYLTGQVYGGIHLSLGEPIVTYGEEGAYVSDYDVTEDSCWGFLGYDDHKEIAAQFTDSPITEEH